MVTRNLKKEHLKFRGEKVNIPNDPNQRIKIPELSEWRVYFLEGLFYIPVKGTEPNRFYRLMHRLFLGFKWERRKP